jgi:hypothetical protein
MLALLVAQVTDVRCTNCGADTWTKVAGIATLVGLVIAIAALVVSLKAANAANESLRLTREQFDMAKDEHAEFLRALSARAELEVHFYPGADADAAGYIRLTGTAATLRAKLTIKNVGDKGSGQTNIDVWVPTFITDRQFGWTEPTGLPLDTRPFTLQSGSDPDVTLDDGEQHSFDSRRLSRELDNVAPNVPVELPLALPVPIEPQGLAVPYRVRVSAEGLREPVEINAVFRVAPEDTSDGV